MSQTIAAAKISIFGVVGRSIGSFFAHFLRGLIWIWAPLLILFLLAFFSGEASLSEIGGNPLEDNFAEPNSTEALLSLLSFLLLAPLGAIVCRNTASSEWFAYDFFDTFTSGFFWRYVFAWILVFVLSGFPLIALAILGATNPGLAGGLYVIGVIVGCLLGFFIYVRLTCAFPIAALGYSRPFSSSWKMTSGQTIRIAVGVLIISGVLMGVLMLLIVFMAPLFVIALSAETETGSMVGAAFAMALSQCLYVFITTVLLSAFCGHVYKAISAPPLDE